MTLLVVLDLLGVFVFALSGATLAVERRLVERLAGAVRLFDAAGLGFFVVAGAGKAVGAASLVFRLRIVGLGRDWHAPVPRCVDARFG